MKFIEKERSVRFIIKLAVCFGFLAGLIESVMFFQLRQAGWLHWRMGKIAIWRESFWIIPFFDIILFLLVGVILIVLRGYFPKIFKSEGNLWFLFLFLTLFDWILVAFYGRISLIALVVLTAGLSMQLTYVVNRFASVLTKWVHSLFPWVTGSAVVLFIMTQGGGWLVEKISTANLPQAQPQSPNILVLVVDTLRADHLSSYGYERVTSPFIDNLADNGAQFTMAISPSSWTLPSHASMLTGRYVYEHGADGHNLDARYPTIGEVLQAEGYRTGAFSGNTEFFTRRQGFGRGFLHFEDSYQEIADYGLNTIYGFIFDRNILRRGLEYEGIPGRRTADKINSSVLSWIDQDGDKPFFVFMNYFDVHDPYTPPEPYRSKYASVPNPGGLINCYLERCSPSLSPEQIQSETDAYDGSIAYVDDQVKNLFSDLQKRGLLDNTIVIITSDHGEMLGEHGLLQHSASLYLDEIHVPLIIWSPGYIPTGKVIDTPVTTSALPSTILSLIDAKNDTFPGPSLATLIANDNAPDDWPNPISELAQMIGAAEINPSTYGAMKSVVGTGMQYIVHEKFGDELYDWENDPSETINLTNTPAAATTLDSFKSHLKELIGNPIFK